MKMEHSPYHLKKLLKIMKEHLYLLYNNEIATHSTLKEIGDICKKYTIFSF